MAARMASAEAIMSGRNIWPCANCSPTACIPGTNPWLMASIAGMPAATACCAKLEAVSGAPSIMLWRMAGKESSGIKPSRPMLTWWGLARL